MNTDKNKFKHSNRYLSNVAAAKGMGNNARTENLMKSLEGFYQTHHSVRDQVNKLLSHTRRAASLEELNSVMREDSDGALSDIEQRSAELAQELSNSTAQGEEDEAPLTDVQVEAALGADLLVEGHRSVRSTLAREESNIAGASLESYRADYVNGWEQALEAYDNTPNRETNVFTVTYNMLASRQDDFCEALFPTMVLPIDVSSVTISVDLLTVQEFYVRSLHGRNDGLFNGKNIIRGLIDPTILKNDSTLNVPIYVESDEKVKGCFVEESVITPEEVTLETGEKVKTSWLSVKGARGIDYLALCATEMMTRNGPLTQSDALDASVQLSDLLIRFDDNKLIALSDLDLSSEATFTPSPQMHDRMMNLIYINNNVIFDKNTMLTSGTKFTDMDSVEQQAKFTLSVNISIDLSTAKIMTSDASIQLNDVIDKNGNHLPFDSGPGKNVADIFKDKEKFGVVGYKLKSRRVNSNRREFGQLLEVYRTSFNYSLNRLAPISIIRPTTETNVNDAARIDSLVTATYIRCTNAGVSTLKRAESYLRSLPENRTPSDIYSQTLLGAGRYFLKPTFLEYTLDVAEVVQSLQTSGLVADVQATLVNHIRSAVYNLYIQSGYKAAHDTLYGANNKKPLVVIATDQLIANYLMITGDLRTLGNEFECQVVQSTDERMVGCVNIVFGKSSGSQADLTNPIHFGNMLWRPELVSTLTIDRNGTTSRELTVQPSFTHMIHSPVMAKITVANLDEAFTKLLAYKVKNQA